MSRKSADGQLSFLDDESDAGVKDTSTTFADNLSLAIHRWFRYSAGFSATWVREVLTREREQGRCRVLDPFAGSGTVPLEAESCGLDSAGIEAHPFIARVARAKLHWREDPKAFRARAREVLESAGNLAAIPSNYPRLIEGCYPPEVLSRLDTLRRSWEMMSDDSPLSELIWLTLTSILRSCSPAGTAQWQYVLPNESKSKTLDPFAAFEAKVHQVSGDMASRQKRAMGPPALIHQEDARACMSIPEGWAQLILTSPPYANNFDYADSTRLEMSFFNMVQSWGDLQGTVRRHLVRSCTQHVVNSSETTSESIGSRALDRIRDELSVHPGEACAALLSAMTDAFSEAHDHPTNSYFVS